MRRECQHRNLENAFSASVRQSGVCCSGGESIAGIVCSRDRERQVWLLATVTQPSITARIFMPDDFQVSVAGISCHSREVFIWDAHLILEELPSLWCLISVQAFVEVVRVPQDPVCQALDQKVPVFHIARCFREHVVIIWEAFPIGVEQPVSPMERGLTRHLKNFILVIDLHSHPVLNHSVQHGHCR